MGKTKWATGRNTKGSSDCMSWRISTIHVYTYNIFSQ